MHHNSLSAVKRPLPPETISDQKILHLVEPTFDGISLSAGRLWLICALMKAFNGVYQGPPGFTSQHNRSASVAKTKLASVKDALTQNFTLYS